MLVGETWEELARVSVGRVEPFGTSWQPARRWWGKTREGPLEIDVLAESADDPGYVLVGEAKRSATPNEVPRLLAELERRAALCPALMGRRIETVLWILDGVRGGKRVVSGRQVVDALR
jgi:uncharacterized protein